MHSVEQQNMNLGQAAWERSMPSPLRFTADGLAAQIRHELAVLGVDNLSQLKELSSLDEAGLQRVSRVVRLSDRLSHLEAGVNQDIDWDRMRVIRELTTPEPVVSVASLSDGTIVVGTHDKDNASRVYALDGQTGAVIVSRHVADPFQLLVTPDDRIVNIFGKNQVTWSNLERNISMWDPYCLESQRLQMSARIRHHVYAHSGQSDEVMGITLGSQSIFNWDHVNLVLEEADIQTGVVKRSKPFDALRNFNDVSLLGRTTMGQLVWRVNDGNIAFTDNAGRNVFTNSIMFRYFPFLRTDDAVVYASKNALMVWSYNAGGQSQYFDLPSHEVPGVIFPFATNASYVGVPIARTGGNISDLFVFDTRKKREDALVWQTEVSGYDCNEQHITTTADGEILVAVGQTITVYGQTT